MDARDVIVLPASPSQERLWFLSQLDPEAPVYNMAARVDVDDAIDMACLQAAVGDVVARHEVLRTTFARLDRQLVQLVEGSAPPEVTQYDLSGADAGPESPDVAMVVKQEARRLFDLTRGPLVRVAVVSRPHGSWTLVATVHHIVSDAWSVRVLLTELSQAYSARRSGNVPRFTPLPIQYGDYAAWMRRRLDELEFEGSLSYWLETLEGAPLLELPTDRPRRGSSNAGRVHRFAMPAPLAASVRRFAGERRLSTFVVLISAFLVVVHRWTGQDDICVGVPVAGRGHPDTSMLIGCFVNTVVLRARLDGDPTVRDLLWQVRSLVGAALDNQDLPFERLVSALRPARQIDRNPLFDLLFAYEAEPTTRLPLGTSDGTVEELDCEASRVDLSIAVVDDGDALAVSIEYKTALFDETTITRIGLQFTTAVKAIMAGDEQPISQVAVLPAEERTLVVATWNATSVPYPRDASIHRLFEEQVARSPDSTAVRFAGVDWTYQALNERANQLAHHLLARGVASGDVVGLLLEPAFDVPVAILAVLKTGAAYLPLDATQPPDRLRFMLDDAFVSHVITNDGPRSVAKYLGRHVIDLTSDLQAVLAASADPLGVPGEGTDLAYVIYTSGSSGQPKGARIPHRGVIRLVKNVSYVRLDDTVRFLQLSPLTFDASVIELYGPLLNGGVTLLSEGNRHFVDRILQAISSDEPNAAVLIAPQFQLMVDHHLSQLGSFQQVLFGGDVVSAHHVARAFRALPHTRLVHCYGPTETTLFSTCLRVSAEPGEVLPIGRPIENTQTYVLSPSLQPLPIGAPGELYVGGDGVGLGYVNRPDLTAERFIDDPFQPGGGRLLYRTGDRARWLPDGTLEFLGRLDNQVKVRGYRIELGEVEAAVRSCRGIADAAATVQTIAREPQLVVYVVADDGGASPDEVHHHLRSRLPHYMVPSRVVRLDELPLTRNGKLDRNALRLPADERPLSAGADLEDDGSSSAVVASAFREVLGHESVGVDDDFFDLGGTSLSVVDLFEVIDEKAPGVVTLAEVFESGTVRRLAALLDRRSDIGRPRTLVIEL